MFMNLSIIGSGYVGLSTGIGFAMKGHNVTCVDIDEKKVREINSAMSPIYEPNFEENLKKVLQDGFFKASSSIPDFDVAFITVGTPSKKDGEIDLRYVKDATKSLGKKIKKIENFCIVAVKSTVLPGTTEDVVIPILEKESGKICGDDFGVCSNPEFLREGSALSNFLNPDRIVIGAENERVFTVLEKLYSDFKAPIFKCDIKTAEMIKYASNAFLATKISFINEICNICKKVGIDVYTVKSGMALDRRINPSFLNAGCGFGGSCFPKDVKALIKFGEKLGVDCRILRSVMEVNDRQKERILELLINKVGSLRGKKVGVLGLSFKKNTDDIRESPSLTVIKKLLDLYADIGVYDPKAMENVKKIYPDILYFENAKTLIEWSEIILVLSDWEEFATLPREMFDGKIVLEGRRVLRDDIKKEGLCW